MKIRIYPKIPGARPMIFSEAEDVLIRHSGVNWVIDFNHVDHIRKDKKVSASSRFTSENAMAYTLLFESSKDVHEVSYEKE